MTAVGRVVRQTGGMTLTEFLLARIAEDEAEVARADLDPHDSHLSSGPIAARVLAECEARRGIVEHPPYRFEDGADSDGAYAEWLRCVRLLASVYADHPDFQDAWRI